MTEDLEDDIAASIRGAIGELSGDSAPEAPTPPEGVAQPDLSAAATEEPKPPERDEHGRFKAAGDKSAEQAQDVDITAQQPEPETPPQQGDPQVPRSLSPEAKAQFAAWPELARQEFLRREADMARGVEKLQQELRATTERLEPLESVIAPHRDKWRMQGMGEAQAVQVLLAAQDMLERNAPQALQYLARSYGVDLANLTAAPGTPAQADPQVQALTQQVQALSQRLQAQDAAAQAARHAEHLQAVEAFASDPKHIYFDNVREDMAVLIGEGRATTLADAYQKACWADETIRNLMLAEQRRGAEAAEQQRRQQQALQARQAAGSIAGSPGPGSHRPDASDPNASPEDDVRAAIRELSGGRV